mmetsp:Transcript_22538/g.49814  ORF Transcript_22538/g.49814 Transcript_22538/m.49814 type:complete len:783 (-) Transcript_22538:86-2434(-)
MVILCSGGATRLSLAISVACLAFAASVRTPEEAQALLELDSQSAKETPIHRVVKLLGEMKDQLQQEAKADEEAHDKMVCWCETNNKEKESAIAQADAKSSELQSEIEATSSSVGKFASQIEHLKAEIAERKQALATATAIREKEREAFTTEEKEMVQALTMLNDALRVLGKHNAGLVQMTAATEQSLGSALRWVALKHEELMQLGVEGLSLRGGATSRNSGTALIALSKTSEATDATSAEDAVLLQALRSGKAGPHALPVEYAARVLATVAGHGQGAAFAQQPAHLQSYAPQSGKVFGILSRMKDDFESNLSQAQKQEMEAQTAYTELKGAAEEALTASAKKLDEIEAEHSTNVKALSDAKQDLEATREVRTADVEFLSDVRLKCQDLDHQWGTRTSARSEEIKAVAEAISILTEDDARDLFHKKMGSEGPSSFVQLKLESQGKEQLAARHRAASLLLQAAGNLDNLSDGPDAAGVYQVWRGVEGKPHDRLAAMAVQVQLDAFTKVKQAIDDMVEELTSQQEEEVKHKELCGKELNENEKETYSTEQTLSDIKDEVQALDGTISKLTEEIAAAQGEVADMKVAVKKVGEARELENKGFQEEVTDQRAMQEILKKAIDRLKVVYKSKASLAQQDPNPPVQFQPYKQNAGSSPVISLLEAIVEDSATVETDALAAEQESQQAYELFVADANASIKALQDAIMSKTDAKTAASVDKEDSEAEQKATEGRLSDLELYVSDLHAKCDFVLKNFDIRQRARLQEIEALKGAKASLSGMVDNDGDADQP